MLTLPRRRFLHLAASAAALPAASRMTSRMAWAQAYPIRPVRVIVPFAPGGPTDVCARLIAQKLSERLGKQFYVENVAGAGGNIGTGQAARAMADGHAILITVNSHVISPSLYDTVPYDAFRDFEAVTLASAFSSALSVNPSVPANTVKDLVTLIKAHPNWVCRTVRGHAASQGWKAARARGHEQKPIAGAPGAAHHHASRLS
jgi:tripartite-type tricarboxylate transporter receptor subunit TctC